MNDKEKYKDLISYKEDYDKRINKFLKEKNETNIVFLNADFGWGKTTFIDKVLSIKKNNQISPWLNKSSNYLEDIYYHVCEIDKGKYQSKVIFITILTAFFIPIISAIIGLSESLDNDFSLFHLCIRDNCFDILHYSELFAILLIIFSIIGILFFVFYHSIMSKPIPFINFYRNELGKNYEDNLIKVIYEKIEKSLVIEDIDRCEDIEQILITINKIDDYIGKMNNKKTKIEEKKYILLTGDASRFINRLGNPQAYNNDSNYYDYYINNNKGVSLYEKIVSLRVDFVSIEKRINNILEEYNIKKTIDDFEFDEIIEFIKNKKISIRLFDKFIKEKLEEIDNNDLYPLLVTYYLRRYCFKIDDSYIKEAEELILYPCKCLNDLELMYKKGKTINGNSYNSIKSIEEKSNDSVVNSINEVFEKIFEEYDMIYTSCFNKYYSTTKYASYINDKSDGSGKITVGSSLEDNYKHLLDNYLLSNFEQNNINILFNYKENGFKNRNINDNSYNAFIIDLVDQREIDVLNNENMFVCAYIANFFRKNKQLMDSKYPNISKKINEIINNMKKENNNE